MKLSIRQARAQLTKIDTMLRSHREIILTRRNKPIARIMRLSSHAPAVIPSLSRLRALMRPFTTPNEASEALIRQDRDER